MRRRGTFRRVEPPPPGRSGLAESVAHPGRAALEGVVRRLYDACPTWARAAGDGVGAGDEGGHVSEQASGRIIICIPIYDDWESAAQLIRRIDAALARLSLRADVVLVDDGSHEAPPARLALRAEALAGVEVLRLRRNLGHQRAIAIGLSFIEEQRPCDSVVVMDGDGEDAPEDIGRLIERSQRLQQSPTGEGKPVIFAKRGRRFESAVFRLCYQAYKIVHRLLTGRAVEVGNFSVVPAEQLRRLVGVSEMWNHYAASVYKARIPCDLVPIDRRRRIAGRSKMNFAGLVTHGLSAISVFADTVGVRLLLVNAALAALSVAGLTAVVLIRLFTRLAIPGWATVAAGCLLIILLQAFLMSLVFVFITLQGRQGSTFLPVRDYRYFVHRVDRIELDG